MASPASSIVPRSQIMKTFVRACGHQDALIHTVGDTKQAARYESTACSTCRTPVISFAPGWGRTR